MKLRRKTDLLLFLLLVHPASSSASPFPPKQSPRPQAPQAPVESKETALYNRDVNRIVCFADDSRGRQTWLGCENGVKLLENKTGVVRHYGAKDGLPEGQVMAIATDPQAASQGKVWCVVRARPKTVGRVASSQVVRPSPDDPVPNLKMHLCTYSPQTGKWRTLRTTAPVGSNDRIYFDVARESSYRPNGLFVRHAGRPRIDVGAEAVTFSLGAATPADAVAVYSWNRRIKRLESIHWDARVRAENLALIVTFLATDRTRGGLCIGTNAVLLYRPKSSAAAITSWSRLLPDRVIGEGTAAPGGGVWVTTTAQGRNDTLYAPLSPGNPWNLHRVSGTAATQIHDVTPPTLDFEGDTSPWKEGQVGPTPFNRSFPVAVILDAGGVLWLTQRGDEKSGFGWTGYSPGDTLDAWWRRNPKGDWTHIERHRPWRPDRETLSAPLLRETTAAGAVRDNLSLNVLPDVAVCPLALYGLEKQEVVMLTFDGPKYVPIQRATEDPRTAFWLRQRFPTWICAGDSYMP